MQLLSFAWRLGECCGESLELLFDVEDVQTCVLFNAWDPHEIGTNGALLIARKCGLHIRSTLKRFYLSAYGIGLLSRVSIVSDSSLR
eukprot:1948527-Amphidinium_carterae.1